MTVAPAAGAPSGALATAPPAADRRRAKRRAAWRRRGTVLLFMSPWLARLHHLLRLPARDERVPLVHPLRPPQPAALGRSRQLPLPARHRRAGVAGGQEHPLADRGDGSAPGRVRLRRGRDADAREARRRLLPHRLLPAGADPAGRRDARLRLPAQSRRPGRSTPCSRRSGSAARSGSTTRPGRSRRSSCSPSGGSGTS